jgi:putative PIN family toxin of toxin-antitoxin system
VIIVFDTNVWISALIQSHRRGAPVLALEKASTVDKLAICPPLEAEIKRILMDKFSWHIERVQQALHPLTEFALRVSVDGLLKVCRDPDDDMILECAVNSRAEVIITGDKDLLSLGTFQGIRILTSAEYLAAAP